MPNQPKSLAQPEAPALSPTKLPRKSTPLSATALTSLRLQAEETFRAKFKQELKNPDNQPASALQQVLYETQVQQIELELQNEELRRIREELEIEKAQYSDFYNRAPVGYLTIRESGLILEANLTLTKILGISRAALLKQTITRFILKEDHEAYAQFFQQLLAAQHEDAGLAEESQVCELRMERPDGTVFWASLMATLVAGKSTARVIRIVLSDITARGEMTRALTESEGHLRRAEQIAGIGHWEINLTTQKVVASANARALFGLGDEPIMLADFTALALPVYRRKLKTALCDLIEAGQPYEVEYEVLRKNDGRTVCLHSLAEYDAAGRTVFGVIHDITRRKEAEMALRESVAQKRALISAIPDLIFTNRLNGEYLAVHAQNPEDLLLPANDFLHRKVTDILPQPLADRFMQAFAAAWDSNETQELHYTLTLGGQDRQFEARVVRSTKDTVITIIRDITVREQSNDKLRKLSHIVEQAPLSVLITDPRGKIEYANPKFCTVTGYTSEEIIGQNHRLLESSETDPAVFREMWLTLAGGWVWSGEFRTRKKNGETFFETAVISPLLDENGQTTHFVAMKNDAVAQAEPGGFNLPKSEKTTNP